MRARHAFSVATAVLGGVALLAACLPIAGRACSGSSAVTASSAGAAGTVAPVPETAAVCHGTSLLYAFGPPWAAAFWLCGLSLLTAVPLLTGRRRWPSGAAAGALLALFVLSFGATAFWLPAALCAGLSAALPDGPTR